MLKFTKLSLLAILLPFMLQAKDYNVPTGSDKVTCTLSTLTQSAMLDLVGINSELAKIENSTEMQKVFWEEFFNFSSQYMAVKVEINTKEAIKIKFDDYLLKTDDFFIERRVLLLLYERCILSKFIKRDSTLPLALGTLLTMGGVGLGAFAVTAFNQKKEELALAIGLAAFFTLMASSTLLIYGTNIWYEQFPFLKQLEQMTSFLKDATYYFPQAYPADKTFIPFSAQEITIPANATFRDIFFLDNKKIKRDIFTRLSPQLIFTKDSHD